MYSSHKNYCNKTLQREPKTLYGTYSTIALHNNNGKLLCPYIIVSKKKKFSQNTIEYNDENLPICAMQPIIIIIVAIVEIAIGMC